MNSQFNEKIKTGVNNLDTILHGGLPPRSAIVVAGPPGSGKTILSQQIGFHNASKNFKVIYFQTLSEPTPKTLNYVSKFSFFDPLKVDRSVHFVDLGDIIRAKGMDFALEKLKEQIKQVEPTLVIIDSFKAFEDLAHGQEQLRKFTYEVVINLLAWECTSLLLGEFSANEIQKNPLFSVVDGIIFMSQRSVSGQQQRFLQVMKMRGTDHYREEFPTKITDNGHTIYAPMLTLQPAKVENEVLSETKTFKTGITSIDALIPAGVFSSASILVSGVSGTGKSLLCIESVYRGAKEFGEKGILFLFVETKRQILNTAKQFGWNIEEQIDKGLIEIVHIPQTNISVEENLLMMHEMAIKFGAKRIVFDSLTVFLNRLVDPILIREKVFQLCTISKISGAVCFLIVDVPAGTDSFSRFGIEESVVDGIILLTSERSGVDRKRHLEVYKMRQCQHAQGLKSMSITETGIEVKDIV